MKKTFSIFLGSVILTGVALLSVDASRNVYHSYQYKRGYYNKNYKAHNPQKRSVRPHTGRVFGTKQGVVFQDEYVVEGRGPDYKSYRGSRENTQRWAYRSGVSETSGVSKTFSNRKGPWNVKNEGRTTATFNNVPEASIGDTISTERFVVEIPSHWSVEVQEDGITAGSREVELSLRYYEHECGEIGFYTCGVVLSKNANGTDDIYTTSRIERLVSQTYKFLQNNDVTPTYTESFAGVKDGKDVFITRYHVSDGQGGVYTLEGESPLADGPALVAQSKKIFNSFHIR